MAEKSLDYANYLSLETILNAQHLLSDNNDGAHDEMLFIITHQTHELWFKQILFELESIFVIFQDAPINDIKLLTLYRRLERIIKIQALLLNQLGILDSMSPMGFLAFREKLASSSGLQSVQFKQMELYLGIQKEKPLKGTLDERSFQKLLALWQKPNLLTYINEYLMRFPFAKIESFDFWQEYQKIIEQNWQDEKNKISAGLAFDALEKKRMLLQLEKNKDAFSYLFLSDKKDDGLSQKAMKAALFIFLYRHQPILQIPYQILNALIKIDENFISWRQKHLLMVKRLIGEQMGSGGTSGANFLEKHLNKQAFSDLTKLSSFMLAEPMLPKLPENLLKKMGFLGRVDI